MQHFSYRLVFSAVSSLSFSPFLRPIVDVSRFTHGEKITENFYVDILLCLSIIHLHVRDDYV